MTKPLVLPLALVSIFLLWPSAPALAHHQPPVTIQVAHSDGTTSTFSIPSANALSGMTMAVADLGTDGIDEIILGNGLGNEPRVRLLRGDGSEITSFLAYDATLGVGVNVAVCDLDGDGQKTIITAPQRGGSPQVRFFTSMGESEAIGDLMAYAETFRGGVNLVCGDLDNDGFAELVTLPAPGGGPHVRVWKLSEGTMQLHEEFFAFDGSDRRGLVGTIADGKLTVASAQGRTVDVRTYVIHSAPTTTFTTSLAITEPGVTSVYVDSKHDNTLKLTTDSAARMYEISTGTSTAVNDTTGSIVTADATFASDTTATLIVPAKPSFGGVAEGKSIVVDISDQQLYAYENGILTNTFAVSTGKYPYFTPVGNHSVLAKLPYVHYAGVDLDGTAWDLGLVPWNLRIYPKHYIHYAYWHNNFGHPMSHGCVNVNLENMKWVYDWADVGTPVEVRE